MAAATEGSAEDILSELEGLFRAAFALDAWGRLLVYLVADPRPGKAGALVVGDVQVEEISDDAAVDRAFSSRDVPAALPAITTAITTLSMLAGVSVADVGGGTFVRRGERGLAFLPGPVRTPSRSFDARRDELVGVVNKKNDDLCRSLGVSDLGGISCDTETCRFHVDAPNRAASGKAVVVGSFSRPKRSWVWGAHNPTLAAPSKKESAALLDNASDRSMWEISTPGFHTDEATAWALAASLVVDRKLDALVRVEQPEGFLLVALSEIRTEKKD